MSDDNKDGMHDTFNLMPDELPPPSAWSGPDLTMAAFNLLRQTRTVDKDSGQLPPFEESLMSIGRLYITKGFRFPMSEEETKYFVDTYAMISKMDDFKNKTGDEIEKFMHSQYEYDGMQSEDFKYRFGYHWEGCMGEDYSWYSPEGFDYFISIKYQNYFSKKSGEGIRNMEGINQINSIPEELIPLMEGPSVDLDMLALKDEDNQAEA